MEEDEADSGKADTAGKEEDGWEEEEEVEEEDCGEQLEACEAIGCLASPPGLAGAGSIA